MSIAQALHARFNGTLATLQTIELAAAFEKGLVENETAT